MSDSVQPHGLYVACQGPLFMGFPWQEYWSGLLFPSTGDLSDPGMKPAFLTSPVLAGRFFTTGITWEAQSSVWGALIPTEIQRQAV